MSLTLLVLIATAWGACMVVPGLWLLVNGPARWPGLAGPCRAGGAAGVAAGSFVFLVLVADRLFPAVGRRPGVWAVEMAVFLVFLASSLAGFAWVLGAYGGALS
jgi:hypothetical protein